MLKFKICSILFRFCSISCVPTVASVSFVAERCPIGHSLNFGTFNIVEGTFTRKSKEKKVFPLLFTRLFVPLSVE